jgi:hypothetical protein
MSALSAKRAACAPARAAARRTAALRPVAARRLRAVAERDAPTVDAERAAPLATTSAVAAFLATAAPAFADEAATDAAAAATSTDNPATFVLAFFPIIVYGIFTGIIRPRINPKAGFGDFLYLLVFSVIILNLVLGLFFKTRIF